MNIFLRFRDCHKNISQILNDAWFHHFELFCDHIWIVSVKTNEFLYGRIRFQVIIKTCEFVWKMLQNNHKLYILFTLLLILTIYKEHFALKEILFSLLKSCQKWINHSGVWINKIIQKPQNYCDTLQKRTMVTIEDPTLNEASGLIASR